MTHIRTLDGKSMSAQIFAQKLSLLANAQEICTETIHSCNAEYAVSIATVIYCQSVLVT